MSKEITDAMLAARAIASASERYDKIMERDLWLAWKESHLAALEVERESLRLLEEYRDEVGTLSASHGPKVDAHIQVLRTRLLKLIQE